MEDLMQLVRDRQRFLERDLAKRERKADQYPEGRLEVIAHPGKAQYYWVHGESKEYLSETMRRQVKLLAQKQYDQKVMASETKELSALYALIRKLSKVTPAENIFEGLSLDRQELVTPIVPTDEQFVAEWLGRESHGNAYHAERLVYKTARGDAVRSKSEALIADRLYRAGIPYKYECPLILKGKTVYPDFTLLDIRYRREVYWEHFGLLTNTEYFIDYQAKMLLYEQAGLRASGQFVSTTETSSVPLDLKLVDTIVSLFAM